MNAINIIILYIIIDNDINLLTGRYTKHSELNHSVIVTQSKHSCLSLCKLKFTNCSNKQNVTNAKDIFLSTKFSK